MNRHMPMCFVVAAETTHQGPGRLANPLPLPAAHGDDYREIAVLAFPSQEPRLLSVEGAHVTTSSGIDARLDQLPEGELLPRPQGKTSPFAVIEADQAFTARSLVVEASGGLAIEIEASDNGENWRRIGIYRDHSDGKERRKPVLSPLRIALEPTTARFFRVQVHHAARPVTALDLSAAPTFADYPGKSVAIHRYEFVPQALDAPGAAMAIDPASIIDVSAHLQPDGSLSSSRRNPPSRNPVNLRPPPPSTPSRSTAPGPSLSRKTWARRNPSPSTNSPRSPSTSPSASNTSPASPPTVGSST